MKNLKEKRKQWTQKEKELLRKIYPTANWDELIEIFQTGKDGILHKASQLGLKREMVNFSKYKPEEIQFIKESYGRVPTKYIAEELGRTTCAIETKAKKLRLGTRTYWSDEEIELLKEVYSEYSNLELSELFFEGRTPESIRTMAHKHNLVKYDLPEQKQKQFDKDDLLNDIKKVYEKLGRTPLVSELRLYGLPSERTLARYFGGYLKICEILGMKQNIKTVGSNNGICYSKNKDICMSKGELVITDFFIDNNIRYTKEEKKYKDVFGIEDFGTRKMDWLLEDGTVVEFFGLINYKNYNKKMQQKIELCKKYNIPLIEIYPKDILNLDKIFEKYIKK